jgi:hypothetical protein
MTRWTRTTTCGMAAPPSQQSRRRSVSRHPGKPCDFIPRRLNKVVLLVHDDDAAGVHQAIRDEGKHR